MRSNLKPALRLPMLFLGMLSLIIGVLAGIGRLGIPVPQLALDQLAYHGILMVPAFFATVIGLERAVAIGQRWAYLAPLLTGIGGAALLAGAAPAVSLTLIVVGNLVFVLASLRIVAIQLAIHNLILLAGAIALLIGDGLLIHALNIDTALYWWISFLLLTIAGERLELSRLAIRDRAPRLLLAMLTMIPFLGAIISTFLHETTGTLLFCIGMGAIALWLIRFDVARRTVMQTGLTRFTAVCMLAGYAWLLLSAILLSGFYFGWEAASRDAALHSFFLGFVFSMVIGHALIIFPAVTGLRIPYTAIIYLPLVILQLSLLVRVAASMAGQPDVLRQAAASNAIALALFIVVLIWQIVRANLIEHYLQLRQYSEQRRD